MDGWIERWMDVGRLVLVLVWAFGYLVLVAYLVGLHLSLDTFTNSTSHGQATRHAEGL